MVGRDRGAVEPAARGLQGAPGQRTQTVKITPHLCFEGNCETAFRFYQQVLEGRITTMLAYGDTPMAPQVAPGCPSRGVSPPASISFRALTSRLRVSS